MRSIVQLDQDHTQWRAVLELADEFEARIPEGDPHAAEVSRHLRTTMCVVEHAITTNRARRPDTEQSALDLEATS